MQPRRPPRIVSGRAATSDELAWERRAQELEFDALPGIRTVSERWAASVGAVTGIFGVVGFLKGREDVQSLADPWGVLFGVAFLLALLSALASIVLAAFAAQGRPRKIRMLTGERLRAWHREAARTAAAQLFASRLLAVVAVVLLVVAVAVTWYGPARAADRAPALLVVTRSGMITCGQLLVREDGTVAVVPDGTGPATTPMDPAGLLAVQAVHACPRPATGE